MSKLRPWAPALLLALALAVVVVVAGTRDGGPKTNADRVEALAKEVRCPVCRSETVYDSQATAALSIKQDIARRVATGQTDAEILAFIEAQYPGSIITPGADGLDLVVWVLPVVVLVAGAGGLVLAMRRWQGALAPEASEDDRRLVAAALRAEADDVGEGSGR